jgi:archaellum component FlaC
MAKYRITAPSGEKFDITAPEGASQEQVMAYAQQQFNSQPKLPTASAPELPKSYTAGEAALEGAKNLVPSALKFGVDTASTLLHPIDTATNVGRLAEGSLANLSEAIPGKATPVQNRYTQAMQPSEEYKQSLEKSKGVASAVGKQYADRYGSMEGFKRAVAEDPASILGDISTVLTGGASLAPKAGKLASALRTAGDVTNPLYAAEKIISTPAGWIASAAKGTIGTATGAGGEAINQAVKAGETGNQVFLNNLRKQADMKDVIKTASEGLDRMKAEKNSAYRSGMVDITNDKSVLSFDDIDEAVKNAKTKGSYEGKPTNQKTLDAVADAEEAVKEWKSDDPSKFHTPEGLDNLKQRIGSILEDLPYDSQARVAINDIYHATKNTIQKQAPTYADVMKNYSEAADEINNIKSALSLNKKASADTSLKKLQSILRDDVSSSFGHRKQMAEKLIEHGADDLMPALAGQALSSWKPRGMLGNLETAGGAYYALTHPAALGSALMAAPFIMPRTAGEMAYAYGKGKGALKSAGEKVPFTKEQARKAALLLQQTQSNEGKQ